MARNSCDTCHASNRGSSPRNHRQNGSIPRCDRVRNLNRAWKRNPRRLGSADAATDNVTAALKMRPRSYSPTFQILPAWAGSIISVTCSDIDIRDGIRFPRAPLSRADSGAVVNADSVGGVGNHEAFENTHRPASFRFTRQSFVIRYSWLGRGPTGIRLMNAGTVTEHSRRGGVLSTGTRSKGGIAPSC